MFTRHAHARSSYPCSLANLLKLHFLSNYTALAFSVGTVTRYSPAAPCPVSTPHHALRKQSPHHPSSLINEPIKQSVYDRTSVDGASVFCKGNLICIRDVRFFLMCCHFNFAVTFNIQGDHFICTNPTLSQLNLT